MPLHAEDIEDAREALRDAGRDAGTFTFRYVAYPRLSCATGPPLAEVTVTNTATAVARSYPDRPGSAWIAAFRDDLAGGVY